MLLALTLLSASARTLHPGGAHAGYQTHVLVEWEGGRVGDMVADAVIAVLLQVLVDNTSRLHA